MKTIKYQEMNIFQEARQREVDGMGYCARRFKILWENKNCGHNWLAIEWGIRWSDNLQLFPIWNSSNNCSRSITFGIWKLYFEINYHRKNSFNQSRKFYKRKNLWKFYQLVS